MVAHKHKLSMYLRQEVRQSEGRPGKNKAYQRDLLKLVRLDASIVFSRNEREEDMAYRFLEAHIVLTIHFYTVKVHF